MEREIPKWFNAFARSCSELTSFTFFTPGRDFGSLENKMLMLMARNWDNIKYLEISGEDITLDGNHSLMFTYLQFSDKVELFLLFLFRNSVLKVMQVLRNFEDQICNIWA